MAWFFLIVILVYVDVFVFQSHFSYMAITIT
jgi:hypothetical protein